jgi:hypothetical protein
MSYTSTLMRFKKKESSCILFTEYRHPWRCKRFFQQNHKREFLKLLGFLLLLCLSPQFFCNRGSTERQTQRKITSTTKLSSIELPFSPTMFPKKSYPLQPFSSFSSEPRSFHPEASSPHRCVFSFTLPNRHFIIAAPTQITTSEPPSSLHSIAAILQISQQKRLTQTKRYSPCRHNAKAVVIDAKRLKDVPINFPDQWALISWGNLISHYIGMCLWCCWKDLVEQDLMEFIW